MGSPRDFVEALESAIELSTGLSKSKLILNASLNPKQILDRVFSVEFKTMDTRKDMGQQRLYLGHDVAVSYVHIVDPHNQVKSRND